MLVVLAIAVFCAIVALPRLNYVLQNEPFDVFIWDDYWHLHRLTAVAETGLPPRNPFFPDYPLQYYYWSWIHPAILVNGPLPSLGEPRSLAVHVVLLTAAFLLTGYAYLRLNFRSVAARVMGLLLLTLCGGLDFYVSEGGAAAARWQEGIPGLSSHLLISDFFGTYLWVPQHTLALLSFLAALLVWRNLRLPLILKALLVGMLGAVMFGSSVFVFLSACVASAVMAFVFLGRLARRIVGGRMKVQSRWKEWVGLGLAGGAVFAASSWRMVSLFAGRPSVLAASDFRFLIVERFLSGHRELAYVLDRLASLASLPLAALPILAIELGPALIFFLIWCLSRPWKARPIWDRWLAIFPWVYAAIIFVVKDLGNNIAMRGMLPAQLLIVFGAVAWVDTLRWSVLSRGRKVLLAYVAIVLLGSTAMATLFEIDYFARPGIGTSGVQLGRLARLFPASRQLPEELTYLRWVNAETPRGALLVEPDAQVGDARYWLLQRVRYLGPESLAALEEAAPDTIYHMPWQVATEKHDGAEDLIRQALASKYVRETASSVYVVWRSPELLPIEGELVYSDGTVKIFRVDVPAVSVAGLPNSQ